MAIVTFVVAVTSLATGCMLCVLVLKQHRAVREAVEQIRETVQRQDVLAKRIDALPGEEAVEQLVQKHTAAYKLNLEWQIETSVAVAKKDIESLVERKLEAQRLEIKKTVAGVERRIEEVKRAIPEQVEKEAGKFVRIADSLKAVTKRATRKLRRKKSTGNSGDEKLPEGLDPSLT